MNPQARWAEFAPIYARRRAKVAAAMEEFQLPPVTASIREKLDVDGYVFLAGLVDERTCDDLACAIMRAGELEGDAAAAGGHIEQGVTRVTGLLNRNSDFDRFAFEPRVLSLVSYLLDADVQLSTLTARAPEPNGGDQAFHRDWHVPARDGKYQAVNVIWALDEFTDDNGATQLVPGTHALMEDPVMAPEALMTRRVVAAKMPIGSALVYNGHLWHRGTRNRSGNRRVGVHAFFTRTCYPQLSDLNKTLKPDVRDRLTAAERSLLNLTEPPP